MNLVLVEWIDAHSSGNRWSHVEDLKHDCRPYNCKTVGYLISKKNGYIQLAGTVACSDDNEWDEKATGNMAIPIKCIRKTTILRRGRK